MKKKKERVKLVREEAVDIAFRLLERMEGKKKIRFESPAEAALMHDALAFSLYEFGVSIESIPEKVARYSIDGTFKDDEVTEETLRPVEEQPDEWAPEEERNKTEERKPVDDDDFLPSEAALLSDDAEDPEKREEEE